MWHVPCGSERCRYHVACHPKQLTCQTIVGLGGVMMTSCERQPSPKRLLTSQVTSRMDRSAWEVVVRPTGKTHKEYVNALMQSCHVLPNVVNAA